MKRTVDVAVSAVGLVVLSPVLLGVAVAVWWRLGRPVLFRQQRPGLHGEPFMLYKFRTMRTGSGDDAARLTPFGSWLRSTSLDELPELVNVLKGDMSLVGPRPLLMEYLPLYTATQARRHEVRPGITGLSQISGRNAMPWEDKFDLDVWYVDHHSLAVDLRILLRTVAHTLRRTGIDDGLGPTAQPFRGSDPQGPG